MDEVIVDNDLYDEEITQEDDGTYTIIFYNYDSHPIRGVPSKELARRIAYAAHNAMNRYAASCECDY